MKIAETDLREEDLVTKVKCDVEIDLCDLSWSFYEKLSQLEPFGLGNPKPVFVSRKVGCKNVSRMGKSNEHLRIVVSDGKNDFRVVGFGLGERELSGGQKLDIVYTLDRDDWKGGKNLQLKLIDFKTRV